jgi:hypothetical protein
VLESAVSFDVVDAFEALLDSVFRCARTRPNILSQALCFACVHNRLEVVNFLLAQGADINAIVPCLDMKATVLAAPRR